MSDFEYYQAYLQAALNGLEPYLLSDDLYQSMAVLPAAARNYPSLTLGSLLLYQQYARPLVRTGAERSAYQKLEIELDVLRTRWRVAWEGKAAREFEARLRQWGNALQEIREDPVENLAYFRYEVRARVMLDLLKTETRDLAPAQVTHLENLDLILQALFQQGEFIWEPEFIPAFPQDPYWYLWGQPKNPRN
jgi:hypothetical protein